MTENVLGDGFETTKFYIEETGETIDIETNTIALGLAMDALFRAMPNVKRPNRRTGRDEPVQEVKVSFRRRTGQWLVSVGQFSAAKPNIVIAVREVVARIERGQ